MRSHGAVGKLLNYGAGEPVLEPGVRDQLEQAFFLLLLLLSLSLSLSV